MPARVSTVRVFLVICLTGLAAGGYPALYVSDLLAQASRSIVITDKADYFLGDTVRISGSGFLPNEVVTLRVTHGRGSDRSNAEPRAGHEPFDVVADQAGRISASWLVGEDEVGQSFYLTAWGVQSGAWAERAEFARVAVIKADKPQYAAGDTAHITGAGFTPYANVVINFWREVFGPPINSTSVSADARGEVRADVVMDANMVWGGYVLGANSPITMAAPFEGGTTVLDDGGVNDVGGFLADVESYRFQFRRDLSPRAVDIVVEWDEIDFYNIAFFMAILVDTNGNGRVDYAAQTEIQGSAFGGRRLEMFRCDDTSSSTCGRPTNTARSSTGSFFSVVGGQTIQQVLLRLPDVGLPSDGDQPTIVNVCGASDCVVAPGNGFLTIDTLLSANSVTLEVSYTLASGTAQNGASSWSVKPRPIAKNAMAATVPFISMAPGVYALNHFVPAGWRLTAAGCRPDWEAIPVLPPPVPGPEIVGLKNIIINPGQETRCKFAVEKLTQALKD